MNGARRLPARVGLPHAIVRPNLFMQNVPETTISSIGPTGTSAAVIYQEVFSEGRVDVVDELLSKDYVNHNPPAGAGRSREDVKAIAAGFRERIPGFTARIERIVAEGDLVGVQATVSGSDGSLAIKLAEFFRISDDRIAEGRSGDELICSRRLGDSRLA